MFTHSLIDMSVGACMWILRCGRGPGRRVGRGMRKPPRFSLVRASANSLRSGGGPEEVLQQIIWNKKIIINSVYSLGGWVSRRTTLVTIAETAVVVTRTTFTPSLEWFDTITDGVSDDRCNGSSSKNKCNGKLDLNHFWIIKCKRGFGDQRKSCVDVNGVRPAEESENMGARLLYPEVPRIWMADSADITN